MRKQGFIISDSSQAFFILMAGLGGDVNVRQFLEDNANVDSQDALSNNWNIHTVCLCSMCSILNIFLRVSKEKKPPHSNICDNETNSYSLTQQF
jgi:hypothetical protein